ncbi:MAG: response regulator [Eubacteriales bacterium]|nr:response regulator [Eubacteriales bacterium]
MATIVAASSGRKKKFFDKLLVFINNCRSFAVDRLFSCPKLAMVNQSDRERSRPRVMRQAVYKILIIDSDPHYGSVLANLLNRAGKRRYTARPIFNIKDLMPYLTGEEQPDLVILEQNFPLTEAAKAELATLNCLEKVQRASIHQRGQLVQGMKAGQILHEVELALRRAAPGGVSAKPLILVHSFSARLRYQWLTNFVRQQKAFGQPVYYFPILAGYHLSLPVEFSPGPELSSLLLLLSTGASPTYQGFGPCFEFQKGDYYALRLGGGSEDLTLAGNSVRAQLLFLFKKFIRSRGESSVGLVELGDLPLGNIAELAAFADIFVAEVPKGRDYAARQAQKEMRQITNALPDQVLFWELDPYNLPLAKHRAARRARQ